jgi:hypothetical protein
MKENERRTFLYEETSIKRRRLLEEYVFACSDPEEYECCI